MQTCACIAHDQVAFGLHVSWSHEWLW